MCYSLCVLLMKMHLVNYTSINIYLIVVGWVATSVTLAQNPLQKLNVNTLNRAEDTSEETISLPTDYEDSRSLNNLVANRAGKQSRDRPKYGLSELRRNLTLQKISERQGDDPEHRSAIHLIHQMQESDRLRVELQDTSTKAEEGIGIRCNFESNCNWKWDSGENDTFRVVTIHNITDAKSIGLLPGLNHDQHFVINKGHFLHVRMLPTSSIHTITSPTFAGTKEGCRLDLFAHQSGNRNGKFRIVIEPVNKPDVTTSAWVPIERNGNDLRRWTELSFPIGRVSQEFRILLEVVPKGLRSQQRAYVSIDNLRLRGCFEPNNSMVAINGQCDVSDIKCKSNKIEVCVKARQHCDINVDCDDREDEMINCDKIPFGGMCDFENGWCGWHNSGKAIMIWERNSGPTPTEKTGPDYDHTFEQFNSSGHYLFVNMNQHANDEDKRKLTGFASNAVINSVIFNPPPYAHLNTSSDYRHSCMARFYVHQYGKNAGSLNLSVVEMKEKENVTSTLWWSSKEMGSEWVRMQIVMPNITSRYYLQFEARMGMRIYSDVAIDDFAMSPECFGLNIPADDLQNYNYYDQRILHDKTPHEDFVNHTIVALSTCKSSSRFGPSAMDCAGTYNSTEAGSAIKMIDEPNFRGVQKWRVPSENYYTIIGKGAGGGLASGGVGSSRGALAVSVFELHKDEDIYILIGQQGQSACSQTNGKNKTDCIEDTSTKSPNQVGAIEVGDGIGGGGGGGSFVFLRNAANLAIPLLIAGGGGGIGIGHLNDDEIQHGRDTKIGQTELSGLRRGENNVTGGAGGGWRSGLDTLEFMDGASLLEGGRGGEACYALGMHGNGGFGGGGGGCITGGGGGGYSGGDTFSSISNGEGGTSFISKSRSVAELSFLYTGDNSGDGSVVIISALPPPACGCDYRCVVLDEFCVNVRCICPEGWKLKKDNSTACERIPGAIYEMQNLIVFFAVVTLLLVSALGMLIFILYNRYQRQKMANLLPGQKVFIEHSIQLTRLRNNIDDHQHINFNPTYGNDGNIINCDDDRKLLPELPRENLRLVKALGQGAFGEVYQGLYRHRNADEVELAVAVKTLPEMSTSQAEADFFMEAAIMSKFKHANIVHLIGVCFDRHPRFIVLELLIGGDLKNFLREARPLAGRQSTLHMKDLIFCAIDVARGCRYMESKRFIHRDIAARNCLLSTKGPGRVVKIADFGMARDIYRSDYYRKGGKAMLPIKWMPPEAFLDGIFTSKTDTWSFGVLLWEIFSMGLMPYTGLPNREVMHLVTGGGRLELPIDCPSKIYQLMVDCWHPTPEDRPGFQYILDQLTAFSIDPKYMNLPIPKFFCRTPDDFDDQTIMRPPNDDFCLEAPNVSDYLIPLPEPRTRAEELIIDRPGITMAYPMRRHSRSNRPSSDGTSSSSISSASSSSNRLRPRIRITKPKHQTVINPSYSSDKLISLETPQQSPTTLKPPSAQCTYATVVPSMPKLPCIAENQIVDGNGNGQADPAHSNNNHVSANESSTISNSNSSASSSSSRSSSRSSSCSSSNSNKNIMNANNSNGSIILNPAMLDKNYMCINHSRDAQHDPLARGNTTNPGNNNDLVTKKTAPFTMHGYKSAKRDPHSEISC